MKRSGEVREAKNLNRMLMDSLPHPAMLISADRTIIAANLMARDAGAVVGGYCWKEFGKSEFIPDEDKELVNQAEDGWKYCTHCTFCCADQVLEEGREVSNVVDAWGKKWDTYWVPLDSDTYLHYAIDISSHKNIEAALKQEKDRLQMIFDNAGEGVFLADAQTLEFKYVNPAICQITGFSSDELLRLKVADIHPLEVAQEIVQKLRTHNHGRKTHLSSVPCLRKDGQLVYVDIRTAPVHIDGKACDVGFITDLTEKMSAEKQKEQFAQADKMIALGTLVSGVAHEINNPTNFITLNTPILSEAWESVVPILNEYYEQNGDFSVSGLNYSEIRDDIPALFSGVAEGAERIMNIVADLKDFARISSEDMGSCIKINDVVNASVKLVSPQIRKSTTRFIVNCSESIPDLIGSFQKLEQVLVNLIQNSCQSLESSEKAITVSTGYVKEARTVSVVINDEGCGMSKETLEQILNPFFTTKRESGGTGLGLSVSAGIVNDHGGTLSYSSEPGKGTCAVLMLPLSSEAA